ncbi:MAG: RNA polymerase subunit sigma [Gordonia sp.]|jgi:RNA polymerase sigma-70 factor (ECF subfamily)|uniref:RNA polymerase sigma factor n=1 Tax=Gordonia sp. (in: high G+C Gram-positive bacteria) TaxID=84139 RepID=UPI000C380F17|nr:sigma-70 family RNA polymerase sigma factor [Gordonia sp. (in: high G+C Gram-positive bacteria)]MAU83766.1 RNA polymerase subunit sigma [Gordonia sp. (in: high G+C Gram-positive bacteria)]
MDEAALLMQAREGDQRAFAEVVTAHRNHVWAVCLNICGNPHDAEDALQNTLVAAWQNLHKFRGEARFSTWLHRIAANNALTVVRKRKTNTQITDFSDPEESVQLADDDAAPRFDEHIALRDSLRDALSQLPAEFREAIVLREFGDLTYADIAVQQGVGIQTVKSRLNRARTQLRDILGDRMATH